MNYKILFYAGCIMTAVTLISTIVAFFKCNVIEIVCDLLGIKLQKKVKIKRKHDNKKAKAVASTVKVKKKGEVKIRSKAEIEDSQNTKSYIGSWRKRSEKTGSILAKHETSSLKNKVKKEDNKTNIVKQNEFAEDTGIMPVEDIENVAGETTVMSEIDDTNVIGLDETSMMPEETGFMEADETSMISEDTGIMGKEENEDTCIIDEENGVEEETALLTEEDETSLLGEEDETSLLSLGDEEDETCLLGEEDTDMQDGFAERFISELEIIVVNSDTVI